MKILSTGEPPETLGAGFWVSDRGHIATHFDVIKGQLNLEEEAKINALSKNDHFNIIDKIEINVVSLGKILKAGMIYCNGEFAIFHINNLHNFITEPIEHVPPLGEGWAPGHCITSVGYPGNNRILPYLTKPKIVSEDESSKPVIMAAEGVEKFWRSSGGAPILDLTTGKVAGVMRLLSRDSYVAFATPLGSVLDEWKQIIKAEDVDLTSITKIELDHEPAFAYIYYTNTVRRVPFLVPRYPDNQLFIGRDALMKVVKQQLFDRHIVAIYADGQPGVGKTALAAQIASEECCDGTKVSLQVFPDGVLWANMDYGAEDRSIVELTILEAWASSLGIPAQKLTSIDEGLTAVKYKLFNQQMLVVLEDVINITEARNYLVGGPECGHMITCNKSDVAKGFPHGYAIEVPQFKSKDRLIILQEVSERDWSSREEEANALVQEAGGLPLTLMLVGLYVKKYGNEKDLLLQLIQDIREARHWLPELTSGLLPHSLAAVVRAIMKNLCNNESQRTLHTLRALTVFRPRPSTFSEEAAKAVAPDFTNEFSALKNIGLIERPDLNNNRFSIHKAVSQIVSSGNFDIEVYTRYIRYYASYMNKLHKHVDDYQVLLDYYNIDFAFEIARKFGFHEAFVNGVNDYVGYLLSRGRYTLAKGYLEQALKAAESAGGARRYAITLQNLGRIEEKLGAYPKAIINHNKSLQVFSDVITHCEIMKGQSLNNLGIIAFNQGFYGKANKHLKASLRLAIKLRESGKFGGKNRVLDEQIIGNNRFLGLVAFHLGHFEDAANKFEYGLKEAHQLEENQEWICALSTDMGELCFAREKFELATHYAQQGLRIARDNTLHEHTGALLKVLAAVEVRYGGPESLEKAGEYLRESLSRFALIKHRWYLSLVRTEWGEYYLRKGDTASASKAFRESFEVAAEVDVASKFLQALALYGLARVDKAEGRYEEAQHRAKRSLAIFKSIRHFKTEEINNWLAEISTNYFSI